MELLNKSFIKGYPYEYMIEIYSYSSDRKHTLYTTTDEDGNKKVCQCLVLN
jgi:hypothetical protein